MQAFIATLVFGPSMSALPIIAKQNSPGVSSSFTNSELGIDKYIKVKNGDAKMHTC